MWLSRIFYTVVYSWLMVIKSLVVGNLINLLEIGMICFLTLFLMVSIFALSINKKRSICFYRFVAGIILKSISHGFLLATILIALYESIIKILFYCEAFKFQQHILSSMSYMDGSSILFYYKTCIIAILASICFVYYYVARLLEKCDYSHD